jgi:uncharacterized membrane protein
MGEPVTKQPFSGGKFVLGLLAGLFLGAIGAFFAGLMSASVRMAAVGWLIGGAPGLILAAIGFWIRGRGGFGEGLLIGASIFALIGGICGQAMSGGLDLK